MSTTTARGTGTSRSKSATAPAASAAPADAGLRAEVRELVVARNERRMRRGEEPLEIEAEVDRQLREFGA